MLAQRAQFRSEGERAIFQGVIERLLAEAVAAAEQAALAAVVEGECPHAVEPADERGTPRAIGVEQHFRIGVVGLKAVAEGDELLAQIEMIVDLAIEHDSERAVRGPHGLLAAIQIDDRQPSMAE